MNIIKDRHPEGHQVVAWKGTPGDTPVQQEGDAMIQDSLRMDNRSGFIQPQALPAKVIESEEGAPKSDHTDQRIEQGVRVPRPIASDSVYDSGAEPSHHGVVSIQ
jgi:hypothetical protein